jgi:ribosomal protein S18 acetylase RimI-like enzyme
MKGKIRLARKEDANKIRNMLNEEKKNILAGFDSEYDEEDIKDYIENKLNKVLIYEINNEIVGFLIAQFWKYYVYLHLIVIDKKYRGKGIGKELLKNLEELAKKNKKISIELFVEKDNKIMKNIIKKIDYKEGEEFFYYLKELK